MDFHDSSHVYECVPPVLDIATKWEVYKAQVKEWEADKKNIVEPEEVKPVIIGLRCLSIPEIDEDTLREFNERSEKSPGEAQRIIGGFTKERVRGKVVFIKNLFLDGKEITDFDTFYAEAPPELVSWVCKAVYSSYILSRSELKN